MTSKAHDEQGAIPEIIGKQISVEEPGNKSLEHLEGLALWETRETVHIKKGKRIIIVLKRSAGFKINNKLYDGKSLIGRPHEKRIAEKGKEAK